MALTDKMKKYAKAKGLGIEGYRSMSDADLDKAIAAASKGSTPVKGKTATSPAKGKVSSPAVKGKTATTARSKAPARATANKGKPAATTARGKTTTAPAAKSTAQKSSPVKATAAKGKATRQSDTVPDTQARKAAPGPRKPRAKAQPARGKANTPAAHKLGTVNRKPAKQPIALGARARATVSTDQGTRHFLDMSKIDWTAETTVGRTGKRADVIKALKRFKGNYDKAFEHLKPNAKVYYKGKTKVEAEKTLRWLIARVAYDYVMNTGQHNPGSRRAYGTAGTNGSAVKGKATAAVQKATGARRSPAKPATKAKAAPARGKPAQKRTAPRGKTPARKPAAKR